MPLAGGSEDPIGAVLLAITPEYCEFGRQSKPFCNTSRGDYCRTRVAYDVSEARRSDPETHRVVELQSSQAARSWARESSSVSCS